MRRVSSFSHPLDIVHFANAEDSEEKRPTVFPQPSKPDSYPGDADSLPKFPPAPLRGPNVSAVQYGEDTDDPANGQEEQGDGWGWEVRLHHGPRPQRDPWPGGDAASSLETRDEYGKYSDEKVRVNGGNQGEEKQCWAAGAAGVDGEELNANLDLLIAAKLHFSIPEVLQDSAIAVTRSIIKPEEPGDFEHAYLEELRGDRRPELGIQGYIQNSLSPEEDGGNQVAEEHLWQHIQTFLESYTSFILELGIIEGIDNCSVTEK